jgi:hypothetical protein
VPPTSAYSRQYKMASDTGTQSAEQHCVMKFIVKENVKPAEILPSPRAENGEKIL